MHEYAIFIQARLGSKRFPSKVLHHLANKRILDHVIDACVATKFKPFLLVPKKDEDAFRNAFNIHIHGGSENDVLNRFVACAEANNIKNIIRITSDCPCINSSLIEKMVDLHRSVGGFVTNVAYEKDSYKSLTMIPDGFDIEVFTRQMLDEADHAASEPYDREHVTTWMRRHYDLNIAKYALAISGKYSIDSESDLFRIERAFSVLKSLKVIEYHDD